MGVKIFQGSTSSVEHQINNWLNKIESDIEILDTNQSVNSKGEISISIFYKPVSNHRYEHREISGELTRIRKILETIANRK